MDSWSKEKNEIGDADETRNLSGSVQRSVCLNPDLRNRTRTTRKEGPDVVIFHCQNILALLIVDRMLFWYVPARTSHRRNSRQGGSQIYQILSAKLLRTTLGL